MRRPKLEQANEDENDDLEVDEYKVSELSWANHLSINNSIVVDLFQV
jgi:ubiquitin C-terminal hydrolase